VWGLIFSTKANTKSRSRHFEIRSGFFRHSLRFNPPSLSINWKEDEAAVRVNEFLKKDPQDTGGCLTSMQALLAAAAVISAVRKSEFGAPSRSGRL